MNGNKRMAAARAAVVVVRAGVLVLCASFRAMQLQNLFSTSQPQQQAVGVSLALAAHLLGGRGAVRVHGGGFAGTIQAYVPTEMAEEFRAGMNRVLGAGRCGIVRIRPAGGVVIAS